MNDKVLNIEGAATPQLDSRALLGLAGDIVRTIDPHTEAAQVAVLVQLLTAFGNAAGRSAHFEVEAAKHRMNLFTALVGTTSSGRKGTSWGHVKRLFKMAAPRWAEGNVSSGLATGQGLLWDLRDPTGEFDPEAGENQIVDPGVDDKRRLYVEPELAWVLSHSAQVSAVVRRAWDEDRLENKVRGKPVTVTEPHVSIVGHVTPTELRQVLRNTDIQNGLANRFLWISVAASKSLPFGGRLDDRALTPLAKRLASSLRSAANTGLMKFDAGARKRWAVIYDTYDGRFGSEPLEAILARSRPQIRRLACIYALMDSSKIVRTAHLEAAIAVEQYAAESVQTIFKGGARTRLEEKVMLALRTSATGLSLSDLHRELGRNYPATALTRILEAARADGFVTVERRRTKGRPSEVWTWRAAAEATTGRANSAPSPSAWAAELAVKPSVRSTSEAEHLRAGKAAWSRLSAGAAE